REPGRDDGSRRARVPVDDEVLVGRGLEEARLQGDGRAGTVGEVAPREGARGLLVCGCRLAWDRVGIAAGPEVVVAAELEARDAVRGKPVEVLAVEREVEDRHAVRSEELGPGRV